MGRLTTRLRRVLVTRPWIYWTVVVAIAVATAATVLERVDRVDAARDAWGTTRIVLVAAHAHEPGDLLLTSARDLPAAVVPGDALAPDEVPPDAIARQHLVAGEIVTVTDLAPRTGPLALVPEGWVAVPVVESPISGANVGDRVQLASGGVLLADEGLVVGLHEEVTLVAVPTALAAMVPAAVNGDGVTLLLVP